MDYKQLLTVVSTPRLRYYEQYLNCDTEWKKIGTYFAFQDLSGNFYPLLQMVEVGLRNAINTVATKHYGTENWFDHVPTSKKSCEAVQHAKTKASQECSTPTAHDVIARLTLGFWVYMLDVEYRNSNLPSFLWNNNNKQIAFPNAKNPWGNDLSVAAIFEELQKLLKLRNRLFHHEPIWKKHNCNNLQKAVDNVIKDYKFLLKTLNSISPVKRDLMDLMESPKKFYDQCTLAQVQQVIKKLEPQKQQAVAIEAPH